MIRSKLAISAIRNLGSQTGLTGTPVLKLKGRKLIPRKGLWVFFLMESRLILFLCSHFRLESRSPLAPGGPLIIGNQ